MAATVGASGGPSVNAIKGGNGRPLVNEWGNKVRQSTYRPERRFGCWPEPSCGMLYIPGTYYRESKLFFL